MRDGDGAVLVRMNQIPGIDQKAAHFDRRAEIDQVNVRVRDDGGGGEELEAERPHLVQIADAAVGDGAEAAERLVDVTVYLAPERADRARLVDILDDGDPRRGNREDELAVITDDHAAAGRRRVLLPHHRGRGIADDP